VKESDVVRKSMELLRRHGWLPKKIAAGPFQDAGLPDVLAWKGGATLGLEVKYGPGTPSRLQLHTLDDMSNHGCYCGIPYSAEEALAMAQAVESHHTTKMRDGYRKVCVSCGSILEGYKCNCGGHSLYIPESHV
jgi:hypothetical protein